MVRGSRKYVCGQSLLREVRESFREGGLGGRVIDCLMAGIAVFSLKFPSLLQYEQKKGDAKILGNLRRLFGLGWLPSDTYMREVLDGVAPEKVRLAYRKIFRHLQRRKVLERFRYLEDHYLLSIDGTGHFSSAKVHCEQCCVKEHKNGKKTYYHQMLGAVIVHPSLRQVIPLAPEAICKQEAGSKNDCERRACTRLLQHIRREHPRLKLILVEDSLGSKAPHLEEIKDLGMHYLIGVKPGDHAFLFEWIKHANFESYDQKEADGTQHCYRWYPSVPLNDSHFNRCVNFLDYCEVNPRGQERHFSWITDLEITTETVEAIMRGGRARWHIENQVFNTLKNQGYDFEHNFGHGYQHLCTVMGLLMMLAFFIDQAQELCCAWFKKARQATGRYTTLWQEIRAVFKYFTLHHWQEVFEIIIAHSKPPPQKT